MTTEPGIYYLSSTDRLLDDEDLRYAGAYRQFEHGLRVTPSGRRYISCTTIDRNGSGHTYTTELNASGYAIRTITACAFWDREALGHPQ